MSKKPPRLLHCREVLERTSLPRSSMYGEIRAGRFPKPVRVSPMRSAWVEDEVEAWIRARLAARDEAAE